MKSSLLVLCAGIALAPLSGRAGIEFEKVSVERTVSHEVTETAADFKFKVTGDRPVRITDIHSYCSCLKAKTKDGRMEFKPGEEGVLETAFLVGTFEGEVAKQVAVSTDDPAAPVTRLTVTVTIPKIYEVDPPQLTWMIGEEPKPKTMTFKILDPKLIHVTGLVSYRDGMMAAVKEVRAGREYLITLTPKTTADAMLGCLKVETDAPYARFQKRLLFFNITRPKPAPAPAAAARP